jgi:hypothetical protein
VLVKNLESFGEAMGDPYYMEELKPEEDFLFAGGAEGMTITYGYEVVFLHEGNPLETGQFSN